jgi:hypothetical protein
LRLTQKLGKLAVFVQALSSRIGVQYKKITSLVIISLAIEHTDLMSNVKQGMSNYEVLFLFCLTISVLVTKIEIN